MVSVTPNHCVGNVETSSMPVHGGQFRRTPGLIRDDQSLELVDGSSTDRLCRISV